MTTEIVHNQTRPIMCSREEFRENIMQVENELKASGLACDPVDVSHHHAPGMYAREMIIPADTAIIGKIHRHSHINIISYGIIDVSTEFGLVRYQGPCTFVSEAGTKRCVHAITETMWTTIHATDTQDLDEIEKEVICDNYEQMLEELK